MKLWQLFRRNIKMFLRDPKQIFFTFLSPLIIFCAFFLFARGIYKDQFKESFFQDYALLPQTVKDAVYAFVSDTNSQIDVNAFYPKPGDFNIINPSILTQENIKALFNIKDVANTQTQYADTFLLIGLVSLTTFTTAITLCSNIVVDRERKVLNDLYITSTSSSIIRFSYLIYNILINIVVSTFIYGIALSLLAIDGVYSFSIFDALGIWGAILLGCVLNSAIFVFIFSYVKSTHVFVAALIGLVVISGFVLGAFIPLRNLSNGVKEFASVIPSTQISNLIRSLALENGPVIFKEGQAADSAVLFGQTIQNYYSAIYAGGFAAIAIALNFIILPKQKR
ncbi:ABC transporter permease [Mycoplasma sp. Pen4]|uniref:ABC transporter permease n=1 Tax=Mycoplasma sp. Pen4 TaxID=640330 RepID=UPI001654BE22|nr:ABC transporter permease [Mycoplasma sp. Pen4]QNM93543.1 ABC transporter permease [Mycoplasma sp. Pen4]